MLMINNIKKMVTQLIFSVAKFRKLVVVHKKMKLYKFHKMQIVVMQLNI